ncbi:hypothetical protein [Tenacibaculum maritimum]|uniref:hypothetical protein n=1 Tax=Tenacibaculum maritimum TaxID=107401 RepID=UPI001330E7D2|nr:hypothetical protein [Tenacibaculum maritimum]
MKLYFHISNESCDRFHDLKGKIYQEYEVTNNEGLRVNSYKKIEEFSGFISKSSGFETVAFKIDFGKDSCSNHWANNPKDFKADFEKDQLRIWELVTRQEYEAIRKECFDAYQQNMFLHLDTIKTVQDFSVKIIN